MLKQSCHLACRVVAEEQQNTTRKYKKHAGTIVKAAIRWLPMPLLTLPEREFRFLTQYNSREETALNELLPFIAGFLLFFKPLVSFPQAWIPVTRLIQCFTCENVRLQCHYAWSVPCIYIKTDSSSVAKKLQKERVFHPLIYKTTTLSMGDKCNLSSPLVSCSHFLKEQRKMVESGWKWMPAPFFICPWK